MKREEMKFIIWLLNLLGVKTFGELEMFKYNRGITTNEQLCKLLGEIVMEGGAL